MGKGAEKLFFSATDFLAWDEGQALKHEYVDGEVYAMAWVEDRHAMVMLNVAIAMRQHLRSSPCHVFAAEVKLRVEAANAYFYPDVFGTCSAADRSRPLIKEDALLVVEILSPSTVAYDRGSKFAAYRKLPSLQEVVFIDLDARRSEVFRRGADGLWVLHAFEQGEAVRFASVNVDIADAELYAQLDDRSSGAPEPGSAPVSTPVSTTNQQ